MRSRKSAFLFNMSHDIRTPMNALLGYNQLIKKELTDPKLLHYQRAVEQSGNLLLAITGRKHQKQMPLIWKAVYAENIFYWQRIMS